MATLAETAAIRRRQPRSLPSPVVTAPPPITPVTTPPPPAIPSFTPGLLNNPSVIGASGIPNYINPALPPPPVALPALGAPNTLAAPLAIDPGVNQAYQALMSAQTEGDLNTGNFRRQLTDSLDASGKNRVQNILKSHQNMSDRGMFNSGVALGQEGDINTGFDTVDKGLLNNYQTNVDAIGRNILGLRTNYLNSEDIASGNWTASQAKAAADALTAQQTADTSAQQIRDLIAQLTPAAAPSVAPTAVAAKPKVPVKPKAPAAPSPAVAKKLTQPKLIVRGGPQ